MEPPVANILEDLPRRQRQATGEENECNGAIDDAVLGADDTAMRRDGWTTKSVKNSHPPRERVGLQGKRYAKTQAMPRPSVIHWPKTNRNTLRPHDVRGSSPPTSPSLPAKISEVGAIAHGYAMRA